MNLAQNSTSGFGGFEKSLRLHIYEHILRSGKVPKIAEMAESLSKPVEEIRAGLQGLEQGHAVVLQPGGEIMRAAPFWAAPTLFTVECGKQSWWASCIWDALGVPAMLGKDARIVTSCGCCGDDMIVEVWNGAPLHTEGVIHFAVPVRRWYENIVFT
jgi:hypothetical protein